MEPSLLLINSQTKQNQSNQYISRSSLMQIVSSRHISFRTIHMISGARWLISSSRVNLQRWTIYIRSWRASLECLGWLVSFQLMLLLVMMGIRSCRAVVADWAVRAFSRWDIDQEIFFGLSAFGKSVFIVGLVDDDPIECVHFLGFFELDLGVSVSWGRFSHCWGGGLFVGSICVDDVYCSLVCGGLGLSAEIGWGWHFFFGCELLAELLLVLSVQILDKFVKVFVEVEVEAAFFVLFVLLYLLADISWLWRLLDAISSFSFGDLAGYICVRGTSLRVHCETLIVF